MTDLQLHPTGNSSLYQVIANERIVGRIARFKHLHGKPWGWIAFPPGRQPVYGFEASRAAAMQAFAQCWLRGSSRG